MATVYLAQDLKHDRPVALKVLQPELAAGARHRALPARDPDRGPAAASPHPPACYDSGEAAGLLWYTMPYVEGERCGDRLAREGQLPLDEALRIVREVADALDYAHAHGVVHRDIKPENILLSDGQALVADFGIARAVEAAGRTGSPRPGWRIGTPAYMSPEQAAGERGIDGRSDIYRLGCVLYEMLAGSRRSPAATAQAVLARHQLDPPPRYGAERPDVPAHVEEAVLTALAGLPGDRFTTAASSSARVRLPGAQDPAVGLLASRSNPSGSTPLAGTGVRSPRVLVAPPSSGARRSAGYLRGHPSRSRRVERSRASVAVLPIADLGSDTSRRTSSDGLTERADHGPGAEQVASG